MKHAFDVEGLKEYLVDMGIMKDKWILKLIQ
jgi:hypothetical protein